MCMGRIGRRQLITKNRCNDSEKEMNRLTQQLQWKKQCICILHSTVVSRHGDAGISIPFMLETMVFRTMLRTHA